LTHGALLHKYLKLEELDTRMAAVLGLKYDPREQDWDLSL
jgi:hypothetical protein